MSDAPSPSFEQPGIIDATQKFGSRGGGSLTPPGGGDGMDDLKTRVAVLEAHTGHIKEDVGAMRPALQDVRERFSKLEEKVSHLPSKGYINKVVVAALGLVTLLAVFQAQIQHYLGTAPTP